MNINPIIKRSKTLVKRIIMYIYIYIYIYILSIYYDEVF